MRLASTLSLVASYVLFLLFLELAYAIDPCAQVAQWNEWKTDGGWEESKACLEYFPFDSKLAHQTIDTLIAAFSSFYVFKDIAISPPKSQLSISNVDIVKELGALQHKHFHSDFEFQTAIQNIVFSLYDSHVNYEPNCYGLNWYWEQALLLYAPVEHDVQKIKVFDILPGYISSVTLDLIECEVVEIDDKPAFEVIIEYAKEKGGKLKDLSVRLNAALTTHSYSGGKFGNQYGSWPVRHQLPEKPLTKYKLECPNGNSQTLTLPWIVYRPGGNYKDAASYYAQECAATQTTAVAHKRPKVTKSTSTSQPNNHHHHQPEHARLADTSYKKSPAVPNFNLIIEDDMFYLGYYLKGNAVPHNTGIIYVSTFVPVNFLSSFNTLFKGIKKFLELDIEKIIIDVQNNVGGHVCAAQSLLHILFNDVHTNSTTPDLEYATDILVSDQSLILGTIEAFYPYYDPFDDDYYSIDGKLLTSDSWLTNYVKYQRGGKISRYSQRVRSDCSSMINQVVREMHSYGLSVLPWNSNDYKILSNGNCGSSCALFANRLHELKGVKTVAVGGIYNQAMTYQSYPGLQAYKNEILPYINSTQFGNFYEKYPNLFKYLTPLPIQVEFRVTFREAYYPDHASTPLEYQFVPANERHYYNSKTARSIQALWLEITQHL